MLLGWAILLLYGACSSAENEAHCTQTYGQMEVPISTQKTINFQQVTFSYTRSRTHLNIGAYRHKTIGVLSLSFLENRPY